MRGLAPLTLPLVATPLNDGVSRNLKTWAATHVVRLLAKQAPQCHALVMGALDKIRVVEMAGLAPVPYCAMLLADFGADVVRVDRVHPGIIPALAGDPLGRGKRSIRLDTKSAEGKAVLWRLIQNADVVLDPFRPGTMERMGADPERVLEANPKLVYARLSGFGQTGPWREKAGHDINYLALSGALSLCGRRDDSPVPPANMLGDFGGGGLMCAFGIMLALFERQSSGKGQVVDASITDGVASLSTALHFYRHVGMWNGRRGDNLFDTGAPWYEVYETKDKSFVAVGAVEPQFFLALLQGLEVDLMWASRQMDRSVWPELKRLFAQRFSTKTREEWCASFEGKDACITPVLELDELSEHPQMQARGMMMRSDQGVMQPGPAPVLSRTAACPGRRSPEPGEDSEEILREIGFGGDDAARLLKSRVVFGRD